MKRLLGKRGEHHYDSQQVLYLTGHINYSFLHLLNGEVVMSCRTLKWFEEQWPQFLRVHKKVLINQTYIASCKPAGNSTDTNYVTMTNDACFEIARRRVPMVLSSLAQLKLMSV